jgi:DNA topoisomerase-2
MNIREIDNFLETDYLEASQYNNFKKLPNFVNNKDTESKVLGWLQRENVLKQIKVSNAAADCIVKTEYLEGNTSMEYVMTGMGKHYACSGNNLEVVTGVGVFGSRFTGGEAGASRYIYIKKSGLFDLIYRKEDMEIQDPQYFEGTRIQDKHMISTIIPLYSYTYGLSVGFASHILPRDPKNLLKIQKQYIKDKKFNAELLMPYLKGYKGIVAQDTENPLRFYFRGLWEKKDSNTISITEVSPFESLEGYLTHLDKLTADKVIKDYIDESENDSFKFTVKVVGSGVDSFWTKYNTDEKIRKVLKLEEALNENITMFDQNNCLKVYENISQYVIEWMEWRLGKYQKRKDSIISKLEYKLELAISRAHFIKAVLDKTVVIEKQNKDAITKQLEELPLIKKIEDSYDVYLNMPLYSLTNERIEQLKKEVAKIKDELEATKNTSINDMWMNDIVALEKVL